MFISTDTENDIINELVFETFSTNNRVRQLLCNPRLSSKISTARKVLYLRMLFFMHILMTQRP